MTTSEAPPTAAVSSTDQSFFGHPRMLANLFSVELWERFSFYGMQGILAYYMYYSATDGGLGLDQALALSLVGAYGGGVYLSTIVGAWVADRLVGSERVLYFSAMVIMLGHLCLAFLPGVAGLAVGLICVAIGSGGLKANSTTLVGTLYATADMRRDAGFSIFYMGVNIGALFGPLITDALRTTPGLGFHFGFGAAAVGMAIGLVWYSVTRKNLPAEAHHVTNPLPREQRGKVAGIAAAALVIIIILLVTGVVNAGNLAMVMAVVALGAAIAYFTVIYRAKRVNDDERKHVSAFIAVFLGTAGFFALFQQQSTFIAAYSDQKLDRNILGWEMPPGWVQSINPIFIIIFAGLFAALWTKLGKRQPSFMLKFVGGLVIMAIAFLAFIPLAGGGAHSTPLLALVGILLLFTFAELLISPTGMSTATRLAPSAFHAQMVALYFLAVSLGTSVSGMLAGLYNPDDEVPYFVGIGIAGVVAAVCLLAAAPTVKRLMGSMK
ncbi:MAG: MFS transporter [Acidobacteria bacterium]|nr:MFS transporter [Acidobacteriota bacterium]